MRFEILCDVRFFVSDDRSGQEHSACLAADHAGTDHVISYCKIIVRSEVSLHHLTHLLVPGHHDVAHSAAFFFNVSLALVKYSRAVEKPVPGILILVFGRALRLSQSLVKSARFYAV